jgi:hypothetical protein
VNRIQQIVHAWRLVVSVQAVKRVFIAVLGILGGCLSLGSKEVRASGFEATGLNIAQFDIDGVRLYMSPAQAQNALRGKFGKSIRFETQTEMSHFHFGQEYFSRLSYTVDAADTSGATSRYDIVVDFAEPLPGSGQPPKAFDVILRPHDDNVRMPDFQDQLDALALQKFGPPTFRGAGHHSQSPQNDYWCAFTGIISAVVPCDRQKPYMSAGGAQIVIVDVVLEDEALDYARSHVPPSAKPPL